MVRSSGWDVEQAGVLAGCGVVDLPVLGLRTARPDSPGRPWVVCLGCVVFLGLGEFFFP